MLIFIVDDGKHAVNEFRTDDFNLCILDVMLPNVNGFQIAREIRFTNNNIPLIFLTAKTLKEHILTGYSIGADDYITKLRKYLKDDPAIEIVNIHGSGFKLTVS